MNIGRDTFSQFPENLLQSRARYIRAFKVRPLQHPPLRVLLHDLGLLGSAHWYSQAYKARPPAIPHNIGDDVIINGMRVSASEDQVTSLTLV